MNTIPDVLHQFLNLSVFTQDHRIEGSTELKATCSRDALTVGLHAFRLDIKRITVDGQDASFELRPYPEENLPENVLEGNYASPEEAAATVADHAFFQYERTLQRESNPELIITLPLQQITPAAAAGDATGDGAETGGAEGQQSTDKGPGEERGGGQVAGQGAEAGLRTLLLRVDYEIEEPGSGLLFWGPFAHTNNQDNPTATVPVQVRRARAWLPCVDTPNAACPFDIRVTVGAHETAVASGELTKQTWASQNRRTFHFTLKHPTPPRHLGLAVGPFAVLPGQTQSAMGSPQQDEAGSEGQPAAAPTVVTHFAPEKLRPQLEHATKVFPLAFNLFETFLGAHFPLRAFHQVFVPGEGCSEEVAVSAGMCIASTDLLFSESTVEQAVESWLVLVRALARQWFGVWIRPKIPADEWLLEGLAGYLENLFLAKYLGRNELLYRRHKEREAIFLADDGNAPPLYVKGPPGFPWGALHATESLGPGAALRRWKASAVIQMLEQRAGEDNFKRLLSRLVGVSCQPASPQGANPRLLGTHEFLNAIVKAAGKESKHEISAFHQRWIIGRGCPLLTAALVFNRKRSTLELAIRQTGPHAARAAAEKVAVKEGSSAGFIKVLVRESEGPVEHPINLGTAALKLVELKVTSKPAKPKMGKPGRKKKIAAVLEDLDDDGDAGPADGPDIAGEASRLPVEWVRLDPHGESLAAVRLAQPEVMAAAQLERSKDVAAQSAAISQLGALRPATYGVVNALRICMQDTATYCRIRVEAAMALGCTAGASTAWSGLEHLLKHYRNRIFDEKLGLPRPWQFADLADHYVDQALPQAIAAVRDASGHSFPEAAEALLEHLDHVDNSGNPYSDDNAIAALLDALGSLHLQSHDAMAGIVERLERYLQREAVMPSFHSVVGCTALTSLTRLAVSMRSPADQKARLRLWPQRYSRPDVPHHLRLTAAECAVRLAACTGGADGAVQAAVTALQAEKSPALRAAVLELLLGVLHKPAPGAARIGGPAKSGNAAKQDVSMAVLSQLHALLSAHGDVALRHLAFMALMRLGGLAPTLFREEEDFAVAGPAMSMEVGTQRVMPTASGPAISFDSGGGRRAPLVKLRSSLFAPTPETAKRGASTFSGERSTDRGAAQQPTRSSARQHNESVVDLTEVSNRTASFVPIPAAEGPPPAAAASEQEAVSSPAMPLAAAAGAPKPLKFKFSMGGASRLAWPPTEAAAPAAEEPGKRKRVSEGEEAGGGGAAPVKRQKRKEAKLVDLTAAEPVVHVRPVAQEAIPPAQSREFPHPMTTSFAPERPAARLPSPFAGPAAQLHEPPQPQPQPNKANKAAKKGRTPPPAVDTAARDAMLRDVMAIARRSPTPQPPPAERRAPSAGRQPTPTTSQRAPDAVRQQKAQSKPSKPQRTPQHAASAPAPPALPDAKPKVKFTFGRAAAPAPVAAAQSLPAGQGTQQRQRVAHGEASGPQVAANAERQPSVSAGGLPKAKSGLIVKWSGRKMAASADPPQAVASASAPAVPKGKASKKPQTEDEKERRKQARLLKEKRSLGL